MNTLQLNYINLKAQLETLEDAEKWEEAEQLEDAFLDAENDLVMWSIEEASKNGLSKEETDFLRKNWTKEVDKLVKLALQLKS